MSGHDNLSIRKGTLYAKNKGDTLQLYSLNNPSKALLGGGPLTVDYEFVEMHFHWGDAVQVGRSEHSIDGQKYDIIDDDDDTEHDDDPQVSSGAAHGS